MDFTVDKTEKKRALIAMSGGVDSSVAAYLMKEVGYDCAGVTMRLLVNEELGIEESSCCSTDDVFDAQNVARRIGIPHYTFNFSDRFRECVIDPFVQYYENGMTPNPCIECNRHLKFEKLFTRASELGYEYIVTGHYAVTEYDQASGRYLLKRAVDRTKDQSYVLYSLTQDQLARVRFPLGEYSKTEIRAIAEKNGFINADKPDSQDICFVPDGKYAEFIENYTGKKYPEGNFVDEEGNVLGTHKGIIHYTVGQRKGLGLSLKEPMYVKKLDMEKNEVMLCRDEALFSSVLYADNVNLISVPEIEGEMRIKAKVRYRHIEDDAVATMENGLLKIEFDRPQRAITRGQAVVMYDGDIVVGGGRIIKI